jgi:excisionase family DNA binding protein
VLTVAGEVRYYSVEEAARVLRLTPEHVLKMLEAGELDGIPFGEGTWRIPIHGDIVESPPPVTTVPAESPVGQSEDSALPEEPGEPGVPPATIEEAQQPVELFHGDHVATNREPTSESGWVSTQQAARALGISARTVRWHIERGNLEAKPEGEGVERTWRISVDSLQTYRDSRQAAAPSPRDNRVSDSGADSAADSPGSAIRELADRLVEEARRAEAARVRLELAERAQSSLEAELTEERRRREEAERQRREAEMERDAARRELEALERAREEASERRPGPGPATTPPAEHAAPPTGVEHMSGKSVDTAAAAAGPLKPPEPRQEPPQEVQRRPVPGRRGLLRRFFRG